MTQRLENAVFNATRDMGEWRHLARRQREWFAENHSDGTSAGPCPTQLGIEASEKRSHELIMAFQEAHPSDETRRMDDLLKRSDQVLQKRTDYTANLAAELQSASDAVRNRLAAELRIDAIDESRRLNSAVRAACRRLNELQKRVTYLLTERLGDIDDIPRVVYDDTPEGVMADSEEDAE